MDVASSLVEESRSLGELLVVVRNLEAIDDRYKDSIWKKALAKLNLKPLPRSTSRMVSVRGIFQGKISDGFSNQGWTQGWGRHLFYYDIVTNELHLMGPFNDLSTFSCRNYCYSSNYLCFITEDEIKIYSKGMVLFATIKARSTIQDIDIMESQEGPLLVLYDSDKIETHLMSVKNQGEVICVKEFPRMNFYFGHQGYYKEGTITPYGSNEEKPMPSQLVSLINQEEVMEVGCKNTAGIDEIYTTKGFHLYDSINNKYMRYINSFYTVIKDWMAILNNTLIVDLITNEILFDSRPLSRDGKGIILFVTEREHEMGYYVWLDKSRVKKKYIK